MLNPTQFFKNSEHVTIYEKFTEHQHQRELFSFVAAMQNFGVAEALLWAATHPESTKRDRDYWSKRGLTPMLDNPDYPYLKWLHAIPNGGSRGGTRAQRQREGARMRSEGVTRGIADLFLPKPLDGRSGLYLELKRVKGKVSYDQGEFLRYAASVGYEVVVCQGYLQAISAIKKYLRI